VCLFVNTITLELLENRDIITKSSGHHPMVERADKIEDRYIGVRGW